MAPAAPDLRRESGAQLAPLLSQRLYVSIAPRLRAALDEATRESEREPPSREPADALAPAGESTRRAALLHSLGVERCFSKPLPLPQVLGAVTIAAVCVCKLIVQAGISSGNNPRVNGLVAWPWGRGTG